MRKAILQPNRYLPGFRNCGNNILINFFLQRWETMREKEKEDIKKKPVGDMT
jgi:hypothetical protein